MYRVVPGFLIIILQPFDFRTESWTSDAHSSSRIMLGFNAPQRRTRFLGRKEKRASLLWTEGEEDGMLKLSFRNYAWQENRYGVYSKKEATNRSGVCLCGMWEGGGIPPLLRGCRSGNLCERRLPIKNYKKGGGSGSGGLYQVRFHPGEL